jgi:hypothetical protein
MFLSQLFFWGGWMTQQRSVIPDKPFIIIPDESFIITHAGAAP